MGRITPCYIFLCASLLAVLPFTASMTARAGEVSAVLAVSVKDQKMVLLKDGKKIATYPISTSRFGVGDNFGSYRTPVGVLMVCNKLGGNLQPGAVIKHREATGEVLAPDAPGRDPIVTRIICLRGLEEQNKNALQRAIYIHGTPQEKSIGKEASYGCIRMRSKDIIALYNSIDVGLCVEVSEKKLADLLRSPMPLPIEGMHNLMASALP